MHVFVLPSWYPSARQPMAGLFARDQARALALARPDWRVSVGLWGHHDGALNLRSAADCARALAWRLRTPAGWRPGPPPLQEVLTPRLKNKNVSNYQKKKMIIKFFFFFYSKFT